MKAWWLLSIVLLSGCALQSVQPTTALQISPAAPGRIALISEQDEAGALTYRINIVEKDQTTLKVVSQSSQPLMTPRWSPDGRELAYVAFKQGVSTVYVQTLADGQLKEVATNASAPAWSPDGTKLAIAQGENGIRNIFVLTLASGALQKISPTKGINTEPSWSPDGSRIAFTSDRGGKPQIYEVQLSHPNTAIKRVPEAAYSYEANYSPDGKVLAYTTQNKAGLAIEVILLETGAHKTISNGPNDTEPRFSPDGHYLSYTEQTPTSTHLVIIDLNSNQHQIIESNAQLHSASFSPVP